MILAGHLPGHPGHQSGRSSLGLQGWGHLRAWALPGKEETEIVVYIFNVGVTNPFQVWPLPSSQADVGLHAVAFPQ